MKEFFLAPLLIFALLLSGCGQQATESPSAAAPSGTAAPTQDAVPEGGTATEQPIDVDLTKMSGTMVYSYVYNIMNTPEEYLGMRFKIYGTYDESFWDETQTTYHYVVVADATQCCSQGVEFVLAGDSLTYPEKDALVVVCGTFESYEELGETYYHIIADSIDVG